MGVFYKCKVCGRDHVSPGVYSGRENFESIGMKTQSIKCLATGRSAQYGKNDMRWKEN
jgi:hypothetical protein